MNNVFRTTRPACNDMRVILRFTGENREYISSYIYRRVCNEDRSVWVCGALWCLSAQRLELIRFYNCSYRVSFEPFNICLIFYFFLTDCDTLLFRCRMLSTALSNLMKEGFDVKALRAFRVLRPLRLVSGVPSTYRKHSE